MLYNEYDQICRCLDGILKNVEEIEKVDFTENYTGEIRDYALKIKRVINSVNIETIYTGE